MQAVVSDITQVPEAFRGEYVEKDGKFVLKLEGDHPSVSAAVGNANQQITELRGKVDGFRDTNKQLFQALGVPEGTPFEDALRIAKERGAIDPKTHKELQDKVEELGRKGVKNSDDIAAIIAREVAKAVEPVNSRLDASEKARQDAEASVAKERLRGTLTQAAVKAGVQESAIDDFLYRAEQTFRVIDGKVVAVGVDGTPLFSQRKAGTPLTPEEYAAGLQKDAAHLFKPSGGSGTTGSTTSTPATEIPKEQFGDNIEAIAEGKVSVPVPWE